MLKAGIIVDPEDYELVSKFTWSIVRRKNTSYAVTKVNGRRVYLHRFLMPGAALVDHVNRDGLDNRKTNLRAVSRAENDFNSGMWANNSSGFKGVGWHKARQMWRAYIGVGGKTVHLGHFNTAEEAHVARAQAEAQIRAAKT